jgi:hypothetical protein
VTTYIQDALFDLPRPFEGMTPGQMRDFNYAHCGDLVRYRTLWTVRDGYADGTQGFKVGTFLRIWTETDQGTLLGQLQEYSRAHGTYEIRNQDFGTRVGSIYAITDFEILEAGRRTCICCDAWTPINQLIERKDGYLAHPYDCTEPPVSLIKAA